MGAVAQLVIAGLSAVAALVPILHHPAPRPTVVLVQTGDDIGISVTCPVNWSVQYPVGTQIPVTLADRVNTANSATCKKLKKIAH
jgi:hypothetical protein